MNSGDACKVGLVRAKSLIVLARPDGFEPPTTWFEVRRSAFGADLGQIFHLRISNLYIHRHRDTVANVTTEHNWAVPTPAKLPQASGVTRQRPLQCQCARSILMSSRGRAFETDFTAVDSALGGKQGKSLLVIRRQTRMPIMLVSKPIRQPHAFGLSKQPLGFAIGMPAASQ